MIGTQHTLFLSPYAGYTMICHNAVEKSTPQLPFTAPINVGPNAFTEGDEVSKDSPSLHHERRHMPSHVPSLFAATRRHEMSGDVRWNQGSATVLIPIPHHTHMLLGCASAPYLLPRPRIGSLRMRAGPMVRATFGSSELSTPRSNRHWLCVLAISDAIVCSELGFQVERHDVIKLDS